MSFAGAHFCARAVLGTAQSGRKDKGAEGVTFGLNREATRGAVSGLAVVRPGAFTSISPDPFRGVGRYRQAHIRVQKELVV